MSSPHVPSHSNPKILIVGAGLGGLTLGILLEKANIDYEIFEKYSESRPLGSATSLSPNVLPFLEQLGLMEGLLKISKKAFRCGVYNESAGGETLELAGETNVESFVDVCGYQSLLMPRPDLHALLLSHIPAYKVHFSKRVLSIIQDDDNGVLIRTSDGKTHEGDILIGSDGAYSGVRQSLYQSMSKEGVLPSSDAQDMKVCHMSILGVTEPMDPAIVPSVEDETSRCDVIIGHKKPHTWRYFSAPNNRVCWRVDVQLETSSYVQSDAFRSSEWGSESSGSIEDDWRAFKIPLGVNDGYLTVGDLIENTPKDTISKVMLEEKLYTTWYHRRTVLMGDGAINAMLDAVILANSLYEIAKNATPENIQSAFKEYYKERYHRAKSDLNASQTTARLLAGQTWTDNLLRKAVFNFVPNYMQQLTFSKMLAYRPQATFLPRVENRGTGKVDPQNESKRYQAEKAAKAALV
ncbi:hypothetical protein BGX27_010280 [Mortierella sp. AM989]|nr:hypothetical protein BGX27_010280 [Mortierella sp. AM989]